MRNALRQASGWVLLPFALACGSSSDPAPAPTAAAPSATGGSTAPATTGTPATGAALMVFPPKVYTGFDGSDSYRAPVIVYPPQTGTVTWKVADPTIASVTMDGANATITSLKAGDTMITVSAGGKTASAPLHVYAYTKQQYSAGEKRYTTDLDAMNPACIKCHGKGKGPDHTPTEIDADTDEEIQHTFTTGTDPEGRKIKDISEFAELLKGYDHMWKVTEEEKSGLLAYMRALAPDGFPEYDAPTAGK